MFNQIFKSLRIKNNLTQEKIAKELNVVNSTIGMWEQGRRTPDDKMLIKISKYFGVTLDALMGLENEQKKSPANMTGDEALNEIIKTYYSVSPAERAAMEAFAKKIKGE